jgi:hypothetical protein
VSVGALPKASSESRSRIGPDARPPVHTKEGVD